LHSWSIAMITKQFQNFEKPTQRTTNGLLLMTTSNMKDLQ